MENSELSAETNYRVLFSLLFLMQGFLLGVPVWYNGVMKQQEKSIKDLSSVLVELEPWVKNREILYNGRDGVNMRLRPREIWVNWLLCALGNAEDKNADWTFSEDKENSGDGILFDRASKKGMVTEHIFIPSMQKKTGQTTEDTIIAAINKKQSKGGKAYADGKHLIVFCDGIGEWLPNKVGKAIAGTHDFSSVWAIGLEKHSGKNEYTYWATRFEEDHSPAVRITVNFQERHWTVTPIQ